MTEAEWRACAEPRQMLAALREVAATHGLGTCSCLRVHCRRNTGVCPSYRKLRLFTLDCCLRVRSLLPHPVCEAAIQTLANSLEAAGDRAEYDDAVAAFDTVRRQRFPKPEAPDDGAWNALYCSVHRRWGEEFDDDFAERRWDIADTVSLDATRSAGEREQRAQRDGLHDIFGNPFGPATLVPSWLTSTVLGLARQIDASGDYTPLPILADALQEVPSAKREGFADCDDEDILNHCRSANVHVRGCWVIDLLLGKG
jgi:hypothetical protein